MSARCDDTRSSRRQAGEWQIGRQRQRLRSLELRRPPTVGILTIVPRSRTDVANFVRKPFGDSEALYDFSLYFIGLIRRNIVYKEKELIIPLYKTIVRPHLEYCIQAWRPYRKKDIDMLERVQRRTTEMIQNSGILVMKCV